MKGLRHRIGMAMDKPLRYAECEGTLGEFLTAAARARKRDESNLPDIARLLDEFEEMVEEFTLTIFCHGQIPTRFPVSEPRLRKKMEELESAVSGNVDEPVISFS